MFWNIKWHSVLNMRDCERTRNLISDSATFKKMKYWRNLLRSSDSMKKDWNYLCKYIRNYYITVNYILVGMFYTCEIILPTCLFIYWLISNSKLLLGTFRRRRFNNEYIFLFGILRMTGCVYHLLGAVSEPQDNVWERRRVPNGNLNNLPSGFPLSDHANFAEHGEEMYTVVKHTGWAIVLLSRSFFFSPSLRCRHRRNFSLHCHRRNFFKILPS